MNPVNLIKQIPCKDFLIQMPVAYCVTAAVTSLNPVVGLIDAATSCLVRRGFEQLTSYKVISHFVSIFPSALATSVISSYLDMPIKFWAVILLKIKITLTVFLVLGGILSLAAVALITTTLALKVLGIHDNFAMAIFSKIGMPGLNYSAPQIQTN